MGDTSMEFAICENLWIHKFAPAEEYAPQVFFSKKQLIQAALQATERDYNRTNKYCTDAGGVGLF